MFGRNVVLKLDEIEPHFDNVCVVCKRPCTSADRTRIKAWKYNVTPGVHIFAKGRSFMVPAHNNRCGKRLRRQWWMGTYLTIIMGAFFGVLLLLLAFRFRWVIDYFDIIFLIVVFIAFFVEIYYIFFILSIGIQERPSKYKGQYTFLFNDSEYAAAFRKRNSEYLKPK